MQGVFTINITVPYLYLHMFTFTRTASQLSHKWVNAGGSTWLLYSRMLAAIGIKTGKHLVDLHTPLPSYMKEKSFYLMQSMTYSRSKLYATNTLGNSTVSIYVHKTLSLLILSFTIKCFCLPNLLRSGNTPQLWHSANSNI